MLAKGLLLKIKKEWLVYMNFTESNKKKANHRRRQTIVWLRLRYGLVALFQRPWRVGLLAVFLIGFHIAWNKRNQIFGLLDISKGSPLLSPIYGCAISTLLVVLPLLFLIGLLMRLGTPKQTKDFELRLLQIGLKDRFDDCPVLITREKQRDSSVEYMTFFSRGVSKEVWEQNRADVEDALDISWVDIPRYGGKRGTNRNYIVLTVVSGTGPVRKEPLYDDEL